MAADTSEYTWLVSYVSNEWYSWNLRVRGRVGGGEGGVSTYRHTSSLLCHTRKQIYFQPSFFAHSAHTWLRMAAIKREYVCMFSFIFVALISVPTLENANNRVRFWLYCKRSLPHLTHTRAHVSFTHICINGSDQYGKHSTAFEIVWKYFVYFLSNLFLTVCTQQF